MIRTLFIFVFSILVFDGATSYATHQGDDEKNLGESTTISHHSIKPLKVEGEDESDETKALFDPNATRLDMSCQMLDARKLAALINNINVNNNLTSLFLYQLKLDDDEKTALLQALAKNLSLTNLYLSHIPFGDMGAIYLSKSIKDNTRLSTLCISKSDMTDTGLIRMSNVLRKNTTLKAFDVSNNQITNRGARQLYQDLSFNQGPTSVFIISNKIEHKVFRLSESDMTGTGPSSTSNVLKANTTLKTFYVSDIPITNKGPTQIRQDLRLKQGLTSLCISSNEKIEREGVKDLINLLAVKLISSIDLRLLRGADDKNAKLIANTLRTNNTLTELKFGGSRLTKAGVTTILDALKTNTTLITLFTIQKHQYNDEEVQQIAEQLEMNTTLKKMSLGAKRVRYE